MKLQTETEERSKNTPAVTGYLNYMNFNLNNSD